MEKREVYRVISDIFAVPGLFCLFWGALRWMAGEGALQGLHYLLENALCLLTFRERKPYKSIKIKKNGFAVLLVIGGIFLAVSGVFVGLYYR